jgi:hypothetical protein
MKEVTKMTTINPLNTQSAENDDINLILAAYSDAAERPEGTQVTEWVQKYPQYARRLMSFATYNHTIGCDDARLADDPAAEARFAARANVVRERMMAAQGVTGYATARVPFASLLEAAKGLGLNAPTLARQLNVSPLEVIKLNQRMYQAATLPRKLVTDLADALRVSFTEMAAYLRQPATLSAQVSYKADAAPQIAAQEAFSTAVSASRNLTDAQKAVWLAEDDLLGEE